MCITGGSKYKIIIGLLALGLAGCNPPSSKGPRFDTEDACEAVGIYSDAYCDQFEAPDGPSFFSKGKSKPPKSTYSSKPSRKGSSWLSSKPGSRSSMGRSSSRSGRR